MQPQFQGRPRLSHRQFTSRTRLLLPELMIGALLAGAVISFMVLPFVASESSFRFVRRVGGADDAAITASYGFTRRYDFYIELSKRHPDAEYIIYPAEAASQYLLELPAFAKAKLACPADEGTQLWVQAFGVPAPISRIDSSFAWDGKDRNDRKYRIRSGDFSNRFLVLLGDAGIDVIGINLFTSPPSQRCNDVS